MNSMKPRLSIVVPAYNEERNINKGVLNNLFDYLGKQAYPYELIFADDGSSDGTVAKLKELANNKSNIKILALPHRGKASTVSAGMLAAQGEWRLFTDFDQSTPISEIEKLWPYTKQNFDVVIGSREMVGSRRDKEPFYRHLMGRVFNLVVQMLVVPGILDTQCGFKLFSAASTEKLFPQLVVYGNQKARTDAFTGAFDVELLFLALKAGFTIREVPIHWQHRQTERVNPIKDSIRMFWHVLKMRLAAWRGLYQL